MGSAKIIIKEQDLSGYVPSFAGVYGGLVHPAKKGRVGVPLLTTSESDFIAKRGKPDPKLGVFHYTAFAFFTKSDKLWSVRVTHENPDSASREDASLPSKVRFKGEARFSGALVRSVVKDVDTNSVTATFSDESMVVKPLELGLVQDELNAFNFPTYFGARKYSTEAMAVMLKYPVNGSKELFLSDNSLFDIGSMFSIKTPTGTLSQNSQILTVVGKEVRDVNYETLDLDIPATAAIGERIRQVVNNSGVISYVDYPDAPTIRIGASGNSQIIVSNSDYIVNGDSIIIGSNTSAVYVVDSKSLLPVKEQIITVDANISADVNDSFYNVDHYEIEQRDAFLVVADSQGAWGNKISVGVEASKNYPNAFDIVVYENGAEVEKWSDCTRVHQLDGFGKQMFLETKINDKSEYIRVYNNELLDETMLPLSTGHAYWRENPVDIFVDSGLHVLEDVVLGDFYLKATGTLPIGTRIKLGTYSDEYKISNVVNRQIVLDRPFIPSKTAVGTKIYQYDHTETKKISKLTSALPGVTIGATYSIGSVLGKVLDAGANFTVGGDDGSPVTVYDLIKGVDLLSNREKIPVTLLMDGGFAHPALAQKLVTVAEKRDDCFVYLSTDPSAEESANYLNEIVAYKNSLNINSSYASLFAGWVQVADPYNQINVWVSPVGFAMAAQSYTAENFDMWYPAAGWTRGKLMALSIKRPFVEAERDYLVDNQINPIRYKEGSGLVIWGNETLQTLPSALQSRHVRMLLIVIKYGLRVYLDGKHFDLNTERGRSMIEAAINAYMRDVIGSGVYGYTVAVNGYTTDTDVAMNKVKVFLGIQPTMYMKTFEVNLAIFAANQKIEIV